jgi:hypothetical protein
MGNGHRRPSSRFPAPDRYNLVDLTCADIRQAIAYSALAIHASAAFPGAAGPT